MNELCPSLLWIHKFTLLWRHNGCDGVSNHQPHDCLLNHLFRRRSKKHQSSASLAFLWGFHRSPVNSPHKRPVNQCADQRKHQSSASLAFVHWIPRTNGKQRGKCFHLMTSSCMGVFIYYFTAVAWKFGRRDVLLYMHLYVEFIFLLSFLMDLTCGNRNRDRDCFRNASISHMDHHMSSLNRFLRCSCKQNLNWIYAIYLVLFCTLFPIADTLFTPSCGQIHIFNDLHCFNGYIHVTFVLTNIRKEQNARHLTACRWWHKTHPFMDWEMLLHLHTRCFYSKANPINEPIRTWHGNSTSSWENVTKTMFVS